MYHHQPPSTTEIPASQPPYTAASQPPHTASQPPHTASSQPPHTAASPVHYQPMSQPQQYQPVAHIHQTLPQPQYQPVAHIHHTLTQPLRPAVQFHHAASQPPQPPVVQIHQPQKHAPVVQIHHAVSEPLQPPGVYSHPAVSQPLQQSALGLPQSSSSVNELQVAKVEQESNPTSVAEPQTITEPQTQPNNLFLEPTMYKNKLQEYALRLGLAFPVYHTVNEGFPHAPIFRSSVLVDGAAYTPTAPTLHRKTAEQAAAKLALEYIPQKMKEKACLAIKEDTVFCKSILHEYANKVSAVLSPYTAALLPGRIPLFVSSLVFNGTTYSGNPGKNKKESEQLAARAAILSILESETGIDLSEIIISKSTLYAELRGEKDPHHSNNNAPHFPTQYQGNNSGNKEAEVVAGTNYTTYPHATGVAYSESQVTNVTLTYPPGVSALTEGPATDVIVPYPPGVHQFTKPKPEPSANQVDPPIVVVLPGSGQPSDACLLRKRGKSKNKKKANKKQRTDAQDPTIVPLNQVAPLNQVPPCSVAQ